ncbi:MAG TPA: hypothetical protein VKT49_19785 [Bryobacteraceae bacterium]|nr:hypothetical protein [Bryobacteraceae bacterium]
MSSKLGSAAATKVMERITAPTGMNAGLAALTEPDSLLAAPVEAAQIRTQNVAADMAERSGAMRYPAVHIYCEKIVNDLSEKFRSFSGRVQMAIELRHSQDKLNGLQDAVELYADSIMQMLDGARGDWGDGMFYVGGYEVALTAVKQGGRNFMQAAKITFQIGVSRN